MPNPNLANAEIISFLSKQIVFYLFFMLASQTEAAS
jgi:hypothetical protein